MNELGLKSVKLLEGYNTFFGYDYKIEDGALTYQSLCNCRETFISLLIGTGDLKKFVISFKALSEKLFTYYQSQRNHTLAIANFIKKAEEILKLEIPSKISCIDNIMVIKPSPFWTSSYLRFGMLTLLMKIGNKFKDNFYEILTSNDYIVSPDVSMNNKEYIRSKERCTQGFLDFFKGNTKISTDGSFPPVVGDGSAEFHFNCVRYFKDGWKLIYDEEYRKIS